MLISQTPTKSQVSAISFDRFIFPLDSEVQEELVKLAQFAKHHVPETHPKDTEDFVDNRIRKLVKDGAVTACVSIGKTESKKALELIARCMSAFCLLDDLHGQIVSEGGAKLLLNLYKEAEGEGKIKAACGLARLGKQSDPNITFAGQRMYEVVLKITLFISKVTLYPECSIYLYTVFSLRNNAKVQLFSNFSTIKQCRCKFNEILIEYGGVVLEGGYLRERIRCVFLGCQTNGRIVAS